MRAQWRSLAHAADDNALLARAREEFPGLAEALADPVDRRRVLRLMAASFALAGLSGCGKPEGKLIPAARTPANVIPGLPNTYATASVVGGYAAGLLVSHSMGRPFRAEGNPSHPSSLGATDVFGQATVLDFYDPARDAQIANGETVSDATSLLRAMAAARGRLDAGHGEGLRILTGTVTSPSLGRQIDAVLAQYPAARWHQFDPNARDAARAGARLAYGRMLDTLYRPERASVIVAFDSDLISAAPGHLAYARGFASRRNPTRTEAMSRVHAVEPTPTLIGAVADYRVAASPAALHRGLVALAAGVLGFEGPEAPPWVAPMLADLRAAPGAALIHAGPDVPAEAHALIHAMNERLGGRGRTFDVIAPVEHAPTDQAASMADLMDEMRAGKVGTLVMLGVNPVHDAPGFAEALGRVRFSVAHATTPTETTAAATWFVPATHDWESWSDARGHDGTATILQPQSLPLYGGMSAHGLLGLLTAASPPDPLALTRTTWERLDDAAWQDALAAGVVPDTAAPVVGDALRGDARRAAAAGGPADAETVLLLRADPHLREPVHAQNPWLLETPRPLTKVTWDNPLLVSPARAAKLGLNNGDHARVTMGEVSVTAPVFILPGQADSVIVAYRGWGRAVAGPVGTSLGTAITQSGAATIARADGHTLVATTEHHDLLVEDPSDYVRHGTLAAFNANPAFLHDDEATPHLYRWKPDGPAQWAMSVDLNACIGCNACVVACMSENNVPVVGREEVLREREMHWLRIDRYWSGSAKAPDVFFQPMMCMQCEQAPCEQVCPFGATVHDSEGLNVQIYNRCEGTRFCSNNCPYKVRRFNYFAYARQEQRSPLARNPDVDARARGVMEKCTFCIQRIAEARVTADRDGVPMPEVRTACQQACPTEAITFGDLRDPHSPVSVRKRSPLDYALLRDQNTHPRLTYEARIRNRADDAG